MAEEYPWRKPPPPPAGAKSCGTCANYPCPAFIAAGGEAQVLMPGPMGATFRFTSVSSIPMACAGVDWKEKPTVERQRRDREGAAFTQFQKKPK